MVGRSTSAAEQPVTERSGPAVPCGAERQPATDGPALEGGGALAGGSGVRARRGPGLSLSATRPGAAGRSHGSPTPTHPSLAASPAGRPAGGDVASRQDGGAGPGGAGGEGSRGGAQGPATEAPAGSTRSRPGQVALSLGTDQDGDGAG